MRLDPEAEDRIRRFAQASRSREACGVVLGTLADEAHARRALRLPNVAEDPTATYRLDPTHLVRVERAARRLGLDVVGVWHSHPNGSATPSRADLAGAPDGWWQLIVGRGHGGHGEDGLVVRAWWPEDGRWQPARD